MFTLRPQTAQELYNLRHAQPRNVVECMFGALKRKWIRVTQAFKYGLVPQAKLMYLPMHCGTLLRFMLLLIPKLISNINRYISFKQLLFL